MQNFNEILTKIFSFFIKFATLQISFFTSSQTLVSNQVFNTSKFILFIIFFAISTKSIISKSIILSRFSRLSKLILKSFIFTLKNFYLTMNNLFVLFNKISKYSNLLNYQNNVFFSSFKRFNNLAFFIF